MPRIRAPRRSPDDAASHFPTPEERDERTSLEPLTPEEALKALLRGGDTQGEDDKRGR